MAQDPSRRTVMLALGSGVAAAIAAPTTGAYAHRGAIPMSDHLVVAAPVVASGQAPASAGRPALAYDALAAKQRDRLGVFGAWCTAYGVRGHVGEVGWPSDRDGVKYDARWNTVGDAWFRAAERWGLTTTYWAAGEWYLEFGPYFAADGGLSEATSVADVFEAHLRPGSGINVAGAEFNPEVRFGRLWTHYNVPTAKSLSFLGDRGVELVRLPIAWERIQPKLRGPLNSVHVTEIRQVLELAADNGMRVLIDLHNYGRYRSTGATYRLGGATRQGPLTTCFTNLWTRLARTFKSSPGLGGYGLSNEPHDLPGAPGLAWEYASRRAAAAVRTVDSTVPIYVGGDGWSTGHTWTHHHTRGPWLGQLNRDPNVIFEAHSYFDHSHRGVYEMSYDDELRIAISEGHVAGVEDGPEGT